MRKPSRLSTERPAISLWRLFVVALVLLLATADDRSFGVIPDGQIMFRTAYSMERFGEIGIAREPISTVHRPQGDDISRYGMGFPLLLLAPLLLAGRFERIFGPGASQSLMTATQCLLVALAGLCTARLAGALGADRRGQALALFATIFATPLWSYASGDFSEPMQVALLACLAWLAFSEALDERREGRRIRLYVAGFLLGAVLLTKSFLILPATLLLMPALLKRSGRGATLRRLAVGFTIPVTAWAAFEWTRFHRFFGGYPGEHFDHPFFDGLWRLTVGPNKGLFVYAPVTFLAVLALGLALRRAAFHPREICLMAAGSSFLAVLFPISAWWAWHGTSGWGPRLLLPSIPVLVAVLAAERHSLPGILIAAAVALGVVVNALGVFESEAMSAAYISEIPEVVAPAGTIPSEPDLPVEDGKLKIPAYIFFARDAALSPIRVHAFLLGERLERHDVRQRLSKPPWASAHPELVPKWGPEAQTEPTFFALFEGFRWHYCGDAIFGHRPRRDLPEAYVDAIEDQAYRAYDARIYDRILDLSEQIFRLRATSMTAALYADALRLTDELDRANLFLGRLPASVFRTPPVGIATALLAHREGRAKDAAGALTDFVIPRFPRAVWLLLRSDVPWPDSTRQFLAPGSPFLGPLPLTLSPAAR
jgi:hypothetical protein